MPETEISSLLYGRVREHMDQAVHEVFTMMMERECEPTNSVPVLEGETVTAVVGLAGSLSGVCVLRASATAALNIASFLLGTPIGDLDSTVKDAFGEVCNMLAGGWKGKMTEFASRAMLSVPTVVTGTSYRIHMHRPEFQLERCYQFGENSLSFSIICNGMR